MIFVFGFCFFYERIKLITIYFSLCLFQVSKYEPNLLARALTEENRSVNMNRFQFNVFFFVFVLFSVCLFMYQM